MNLISEFLLTLQMVRSDKFQMYDFGSDARNIAHYGHVRNHPYLIPCGPLGVYTVLNLMSHFYSWFMQNIGFRGPGML